MKKIKNFFYLAFKSLTDPRYYPKFLKRGLKFSVIFFICVSFLYVFIYSIALGVSFSRFDLTGEISTIAQSYPNDLSVTFSENGVAINQPLPYTWQIKPDFTVLFTNQEPSLENFNNYTFILDQTNVYLRDNLTGQISSSNLSSLSNIGLTGNYDKNTVNDLHEKITHHWFMQNKIYVLVYVLVMFVILSVSFIVSNFLLILFISVIVWLISRISFSTRGLKFSQVLQIGLQSIVWIVFLSALSMIPALSYIRNWIDIVVMIWMVIVITKLPTKAH